MITEKTYPIESKWTIKMTLIYGVPFIVMAALFIAGVQDIRLIVWFAAILWVYVFFVLLAKPNFHYMLEDKILTVKQGVIRKQERHLPYGVIQNLLVNQDILDRMFGIASFIIEDASQGRKSEPDVPSFWSLSTSSSKKRAANQTGLGFSKNRISIPGLSKENAELLKAAVLQKMKENPLEENDSGL